MNIDPGATYSTCARAARAALAAKYPAGEAAMMVRIIFEQLKGFDATQMIIRADEPVSEFIQSQVADVVHRILADEPIQYIFGTARFYGLDFKVTPAVLIPRPETAELVDLIVDRCGDASDLRVLDIATGSGFIAIALARTLRFPVVEAIDISPEALAVARENARSLKVNITFRQADALHLPAADYAAFDVIVSNPPYICNKEKAAMPANVLGHEPHLALFVPDDDPLLFYRHIAAYAATALRLGGSLWFEINPIYADDLKRMLTVIGFDSVALLPDAQGLLRFATAIRPD